MAPGPDRKTYIDPDDESKGYILYKYKQKEAPKGIFSSTYYFGRDFKGQDDPWSKLDVYKAGILQYLKVTEAPQFEGWKLILYTDILSLERSNQIDGSMFKTAPPPEKLEQHRREWEEIKAHPNVIFAVVVWPEYAVGYGTLNTTIDNAVLRALRLKAFHDFPDCPVFIRDADTLFENLVRVRSIVKELVVWESTLLENLKRIFQPNSPYRMLIASQPSYQRQWHIHPDTGVKTSGCYAAVTSSLGSMKEWADGSLWRKCLAYLRAHTKIIRHASGERIPDNLNRPTYIGKDEQLLSYVILPNAFNRVYFYYLEYIHVEGNKIIENEEAPFASRLLAAGYTRYPSPYKTVLGEPETPLEETATAPKRKDVNEKTEETILKPESIPLSLSPETHKLLQIVFKYFLEKVAEAKAAPGFVSKQLGGAKTKRRRHPRSSQRRTIRRKSSAARTA